MMKVRKLDCNLDDRSGRAELCPFRGACFRVLPAGYIAFKEGSDIVALGFLRQRGMVGPVGFWKVASWHDEV